MVLSCRVLADSIGQNRLGNNLTYHLNKALEKDAEFHYGKLRDIIEYQFMLQNQQNAYVLQKAMKTRSMKTWKVDNSGFFILFIK